MADRETDDAIEQLLDSGLSRYSAVEPRPGLETRILARIADSRSTASSTRAILRWALGAGLAAALAGVIAFSFLSGPLTRAPHATDTAKTPTQPAGGAPVAQAQRRQNHVPQVRAAHSRKAAVRKVRTVDVRQEIFPTPVPLSEQEVLLLRYLSHTPRQEQLAQSHPDPPPGEAIPEDGVVLFPGINQKFSNQ
jgi:hypothetical protein